MKKQSYPYSIRLSEKNLNQLEKISDAISISKNAVIRMSINELFNELKQKGMI